MSGLIPLLLVVGLFILLGFSILFFKHPGKDDESHVRVGREWMTVAEYKKRFFPEQK